MCDADFIIRPPPPQRESPFDPPPPRPPSPEIERSSRSCSQSKESFTLNALADFRYTEKALPELLPFPFKAEESNCRPRSSGIVPRPSKFVKGSMYHSDYESDLEGPIPAKWRSYNSDTDEGNKLLKYRKVKPKLPCRNDRLTKERNPSPPCPHKWESHEEIEKLEEKLRKKKSDFLAEVALLKSSKSSNHLDTEVTRNVIINETKSITSNTITNESKSETISMSANSWHESKHAKPLPLPINEKCALNAPNDKPPQFEAVNFQTYDNGDGTRQHVLDISSHAECPITPANTSSLDKQERISSPIKDGRQSELDTSRTSKTHLKTENKSNSATSSFLRSNIQPVPREEAKKVESITNIFDAFVETNKKNDHLSKESPHFELSSKEPFGIKSPERSSQTLSGLSSPQTEQLTSQYRPPLPIKTRLNDIVPFQPVSSQQIVSPNLMENSSISDEQSQCSQSTVRCVVREEFVSVKEKIKILEQKVEEQENMENEIENETFADDTIDAISSSERQTPTTPTTPRIKPYDIPGAVRILPPASSSPITCKSHSSTIRKGRRSNSVDQYSTSHRASPILSPIRAPRSAQPSPISGVSYFFPKLSTDYSTNRTMHRNQNTDHKGKVLESNDDQFEGKEFDNQDIAKLKAFKEKLIQGNMSSDILGSKTDMVSYANQEEPKAPNHTCENHTNMASPKELSEISPPRPPLPDEIEHYPLTHSSSGEQLHTFRYTSDTEFATSSMTECAYTECSSLERQSATSRESKGAVKAEKTLAYKNNCLEDTNKMFGIDPISDSGLESETNKNSLSIEGVFSKKRQSRSPFQLTQATEPHLKRSPKLSRAATRSSMKDCSRLDADGYEADTDDTLSRAKRRSVKEMAKSFQQAENACPSPLPFRPRPSFLHDGSDYEASDFEYHSR